MLEYIYKFLLLLDQIVYSLIDVTYQVFLSISNAQILSSSDIQGMIDRVNVIIGIVMLFLVSFSLLKAISNPDNLTKGDKSTTKLITNILIVLVMIVLTPSAFKFAFQAQNTILSEGALGRIILGSTSGSSSTTLSNAGFNMAIDVFSAFIIDDDPSKTYTIDLKGCTPVNVTISANNQYTLSQIVNISKDCKNFNYFYQLATPLTASGNTLTYYFLISTIAGAFVLYIMVSFCIDLGVRVAKLAFYQLIAPIPILSRIIPGKKDMYDKWFKSVVSTFLEVFIKLAVIYFAVYLIITVLF